MRLRILYPIALATSLTSCAVNPDTANIAACGAALAATGFTDPANMLPVALATPACRALAADVLAALMQEISNNVFMQRKAIRR